MICRGAVFVPLAYDRCYYLQATVHWVHVTFALTLNPSPKLGEGL